MPTEVTIQMIMPKNVHPARRMKKLAARVKEAISNIESGNAHVSDDWDLLSRIHSAIMKTDSDGKFDSILKDINELFAKHGAHHE